MKDSQESSRSIEEPLALWERICSILRRSGPMPFDALLAELQDGKDEPQRPSRKQVLGALGRIKRLGRVAHTMDRGKRCLVAIPPERWEEQRAAFAEFLAENGRHVRNTLLSARDLPEEPAMVTAQDSADAGRADIASLIDLIPLLTGMIELRAELRARHDLLEGLLHVDPRMTAFLATAARDLIEQLGAIAEKEERC